MDTNSNTKSRVLCYINGGTETNYFGLERGTRQGYLISVYLFILVLEIAFLFVMQSENIHCLNIFENTYIYTLHFILKTKNL